MNRESQIRFKVCGMKNAQNLKGLVALQPDYIGFIFYPKSPRYMVDVLDEKDLSDIPNHIKKVGVFVNEDLSSLRHKVELFHLDMVQLHGSETPKYCSEAAQFTSVVKAFPVSDDFDFRELEPYQEMVDFFLFDTKTPKYGGSGQQFDWDILKRYTLGKPYFLSGGIGVDDIDTIVQLNLKEMFAIDVNSRLETEPGLKDLALVAEVIKGLEDGRRKKEDRSSKSEVRSRKMQDERRESET